MENINEHSFLNTKHKLSFSQYGNSFEQLKYKAKKIIKNVNFLNSNISLLGDIQQQINHSHCVQKSLNKISKNSIIWKAVIVIGLDFLRFGLKTAFFLGFLFEIFSSQKTSFLFI